MYKGEPSRSTCQFGCTSIHQIFVDLQSQFPRRVYLGEAKVCHFDSSVYVKLRWGGETFIPTDSRASHRDVTLHSDVTKLTLCRCLVPVEVFREETKESFYLWSNLPNRDYKVRSLLKRSRREYLKSTCWVEDKLQRTYKRLCEWSGINIKDKLYLWKKSNFLLKVCDLLLIQLMVQF